MRATTLHAALGAGVRPGSTVAVVGDGAVGLCGVPAARRLGAERIIALGRHRARTDIARTFGATDVVAERGEEAVRGGVAPVRGYIPELLPDVLDGTLDPAPVFDRTVDLAGVPDGYRAMDDRTALKVLVKP
ncbi:hypothetical protein HOK021_21790 [Streptomyces hygroscopicus]|nr:hypothetical protein HOK021_21790 [Streptomyces hygroscopicus]